MKRRADRRRPRPRRARFEPLETRRLLTAGSSTPNDSFDMWVVGDMHLSTDLLFGHESLAGAIRQSELGDAAGAPPLDWDIMLNVGDMKGNGGVASDRDGAELVRQFDSAMAHRREQMYSLAGNHDASLASQPPGEWFRKWVDPLGENPETSGVDNSLRPFAVEGTWERYRFQAGNVLFLMLTDRNDGGPPVGRVEGSASPAGAVTKETFDWWVRQVEENQDKIIVTVHHHMLRETTVASGDFEGVRYCYHASTFAPEGASYLYWIKDDQGVDVPKAQYFENYLAEHPGAIDLWIGGHTHPRSPDARIEDRGVTETRWGVTFINAAAITSIHAHQAPPSSRLLSFVEGSDSARLQFYLHDDSYSEPGWYEPQGRSIQLSQPYLGPTSVDLPPAEGVSTPAFSRWELDEGPGAEQIEDSHGEVSGVLRNMDAVGAWSADTPSGVGHSLRFDGIDDRVDLGQVPMDWSALTISAWVKTSNAEDPQRIVSKHGSEPSGNFSLEFADGVWRFQAFHDGQWYRAEWESVEPNDGRWHHFVAVVDPRADRLRLYVDGVSRAATFWTFDRLEDGDGHMLAIGADSATTGWSRVLDGLIDDVRIWDSAIGVDDVAMLLHAGRKPPGGPRVVEVAPVAEPDGRVQRISVRFDEPVRADSFDVDDVAIIGSGPPIDVADVRLIGLTRYEIELVRPLELDQYELSIEAGIVALDGESMDQDGDTLGGEAIDDRYSTTFSIETAPPVHYRFDFGTDQSPVFEGSVHVTATDVYSSATSYGWTGGGPRDSIDRGQPSDPALRDWVRVMESNQVNNTFALDLAPGRYVVRPTLGDHKSPKIGMGIYLEGNLVDTIDTAAGEFKSPAYEIEVDDGQLSVGLARLGTTNLALNAIEVIGPLTVAPDVTGPVVLLIEEAANTAGEIDRLSVTFDEPVRADSFTADLVTVRNHQGEIPVRSIERVDQRTHLVRFDPQGSLGDYSVTIRPGIVDPHGNLMNQDGDHVGGEFDDDTYRGSFTIDRSPRVDLRFDFGKEDSPVAEGHVLMTDRDWYTADTGYGWAGAGEIDAEDRGPANDDLLRDWVRIYRGCDAGRTALFAVDLPADRYDVTVTLGDAKAAKRDVALLLEGQQVDVVTTAAGEFHTATYRVDVVDGRLDLTLNLLGTTTAAINAVEIVAAAGDAASWQNEIPEDVNDDGQVTPADALIVINYMSDHPRDPRLPAFPSSPPPYYDVSGDQLVSALDALIVINHLLRQSTTTSSAAEPEGADRAETRADDDGSPRQPLLSPDPTIDDPTIDDPTDDARPVVDSSFAGSEQLPLGCDGDRLRRWPGVSGRRFRCRDFPNRAG